MAKKNIVLLGAIIAIIGQFWGADYYLPLIGGVVAGAATFMSD